jgi:hypothetical protein
MVARSSFAELAALAVDDKPAAQPAGAIVDSEGTDEQTPSFFATPWGLAEADTPAALREHVSLPERKSPSAA